MKNVNIVGLLALGLLATDSVKAAGVLLRNEKNNLNKSIKSRKHNDDSVSLSEIRNKQSEIRNKQSNPQTPNQLSPKAPSSRRQETKKAPKGSLVSGVLATEKTRKLSEMQHDANDKHVIAKERAANTFDRVYNDAKETGSNETIAYNRAYDAAKKSYDESLTQQGATEEQRNFLRIFPIR